MLEGYDAPSQTPVSENVGANPPSQEPMTEGADVPLPTQTPDAPVKKQTGGWQMLEGFESSSPDISKTGTGTDEDPYKLNPDVKPFIPAVEADIQRDEENDVSTTVAEVQQAISTTADQLGWTDDSEKTMGKYNKSITKVLRDKGYKIEKRQDALFAISNKTGKEYPLEAGIVDSLRASLGETVGGVAGATAGVAAGAALGGPVGGAVGGIVGGVSGAVAGDQFDVFKNAEKYNIEISPEERLDRVLEVGAFDVAATAVGSAVVKGVSTGLKAIFYGRDAKVVSDFTSVEDLPRDFRKAVRHLMKKSNMSEEQMNTYINDFAKTQGGKTVSEAKAVEAAGKAGEAEGLSAIEYAMKQSLPAKNKVIKEATERSNEIEKYLLDDAELLSAFRRSTVTDKGRRKATDWGRFLNSLEVAGFEAGDAIYDLVAKNAKSIGSNEVDLFIKTVNNVKPIEGGAKWVEPFTNTARGGPKAQGFATVVSMIESVIKTVFPNADRKTTRVLVKALKESEVNPARLSAELVQEGFDKVEAKKLAEELMAEVEKQAQESAKQAVKAQRAQKTAETKFGRVIKEEEKTGKAIEAGIDKDVAGFNKAKEVMVKDQKEAETKFGGVIKEEEKTGKAIEAGIDKDVAGFNKAKEAMTAEKNDKVIDMIEEEAAYFKDLKEFKGKSNQHNLLIKKAKEAVGTDKEEAAFKKLHDFRMNTISLPFEGKQPKQALFAEQNKRRKSTPNQEEAARLKEENPDDKEAIKKALFRKSPEVQAKDRAEEALAREEADLFDIEMGKKQAKEALESKKTDMQKLKDDVLDNPQATGEQKKEANRLRRKSAIEKSFGDDKLEKEYQKWADSDPKNRKQGFGGFLAENKEGMNIPDEQINKYYELQGRPVPNLKPSSVMEKGLGKQEAQNEKLKTSFGEDFVKTYDTFLSEGGKKDITKYLKNQLHNDFIDAKSVINHYGGVDSLPKELQRNGKIKKYIKGLE